MWLGLAAAAVGQVAPGAAAAIAGLAGPPLGYLEWVAHAAGSVPSAEVHVGSARLPRGAGSGRGVGARSPGGCHGPLAARRLRVAVGGRVLSPALAVAALAAVLAAAGLARRAVGGSPSPSGGAGGLLPRRRPGRRHPAAGPRPRRAGRRRPAATGPILARLREAGVTPPRRARHHPRPGRPRGRRAGRAARPPGRAAARRRRRRGSGRTGAEIGAVAAARGVRVVAAAGGQLLRAGRLALRVLWPPPGAAPDAGRRSEPARRRRRSRAPGPSACCSRPTPSRR